MLTNTIVFISFLGGFGGGVLEFQVNDTLKVDGKVSANGEDGNNPRFAGGGSGGSIFISTKLLDGTGTFEVGFC